MKLIQLFTDASVDPVTHIGYGAYLAVSDLKLPLNVLKKQIKIKRFEDTSSTRLELQILLFALEELDILDCKVNIYTDSQNIIGLDGRRERFEQNQYYSKNKKLISNADLYKDFFKITDQLDCNLTKICGHQPTCQKSEIDKIFTLVDKASRRASRENKI